MPAKLKQKPESAQTHKHHTWHPRAAWQLKVLQDGGDRGATSKLPAHFAPEQNGVPWLVYFQEPGREGTAGS